MGFYWPHLVQVGLRVPKGVCKSRNVATEATRICQFLGYTYLVLLFEVLFLWHMFLLSERCSQKLRNIYYVSGITSLIWFTRLQLAIRDVWVKTNVEYRIFVSFQLHQLKTKTTHIRYSTFVMTKLMKCQRHYFCHFYEITYIIWYSSTK